MRRRSWLVLGDATADVLVQASVLLGGTLGVAEAELLLQACEDLDSAARLLRVVASQDDTPVHG